MSKNIRGNTLSKRKRNVLITLGAAVLTGSLLAPVASASIWNNPAGGLWSDDTANGWNGTGVPNSNTAIADFSTLDIPANASVALDGSYQVNKLNFADATTASHDWTLNNNSTPANILTLSGAAPTITVTNRTATITARLASVVGFTKAGAGTLVIDNALTNANLTSGTSLVGTLQVENGILSGLGTVTIGTTVTNGTVTLNNSSQLLISTVNQDLLIGAANEKIGTLNVNNSANVNVSRDIRVGGDGGANNRARGIMNVTGGTVTAGGTITVRNAGDSAFGTGLLDITGGTVTANTVTLNLQRQKGAAVDLKVRTAGTLESTTGINFTHSFSSNVPTTATLTIEAGGTIKTPSITGVADQTNGKIRLALTGGTIQATSDNSSFISGFTVAPIIGSSGITFDSNTFNIDIPQAMQGAGGKLTKTGAGILTLSGANSYSGSTTIKAGTLSVATIGNGSIVSSNLGSATNAAPNLVFDGGTLRYTGATDSTDRNFTIVDGKTAKLDVTANNLTFTGGAISSTGSLSKLGAGTLSLNSSNLYSGSTSVIDGTLALLASGSIDTSSGIDVANPATLDLTAKGVGGYTYNGTVTGNGAITGTLVQTGTISPGNSVGTLSLDALTLSGTYQAEYDITLGGSADLLNVAGALTLLNAPLNFVPVAGAADDAAYVIASYGSLTGIFDPASLVNLPAGYSVDYAYNGGTQIAVVSAIPEPTTLGLLAFGSLGFVVAYRRRKRAVATSN